jgi:hypothetical protein
MGALDDLYNKTVKPPVTPTTTTTKTSAPTTSALDRLYQQVTTKPIPKQGDTNFVGPIQLGPTIPMASSNMQTKSSTPFTIAPGTGTVELAKKAGQTLLSGGAQVGATLIAPLLNKGQMPNEVSVGSLGEKILGSNTIKTIPGSYEEAKKVTSVPIAALASLAPLLDLSGAGGEKNVVKLLTKTTKMEDVANILRKINVADDLVKEYAPILAKTSKEAEVSKIVSHIDEIQKATKTGAELSSKATGKGSLLPLTSQKASIKESLPVIEQKLPQKVVQQSGSFASSVPSTPEESIGKVIQALKKAEPIRSQQEQLYTIARGQKLTKGLATEAKVIGQQGYEAGFKAKLGSLAGELPKAQFESLRQNIGQTDIDNLFKIVKDNTNISEWDKLPAGQGLAKIFDGGLPTEGELKLLNQVFPKEFIETVLAKRSLFQKMKGMGLELANIPRTMMATADLSAPLRQGLFLAAKNPKEFGKAFGAMFKYFGKENAFQEGMQEIIGRSIYPLLERAKISFTNLGDIAGREEQFMGGGLLEKIPVLGKLVRASGRAYTGFLNKLRADVGEKLIKGAIAAGRDVNTDDKLLQEIGNFVNTFSGRGNIGKLEKIAPALNGLFFSPRLMMSRLTILNPVYYIKADPFVRKEALKSLFATVGAGMTALGLAKMAGAEVGTDPRSADFGKIKIGNTRVDIWGGSQQYVRMIAQLFTGKYVSTTTGKEYTLGEGYKPITRWDILLRQFETKTAPIPSFIIGWLRQQTYMGQKFNIPQEIGSRFVPMMASDITDIMKDDPNLLPLSIPAAFGVGLQTYSPLPPINKKNTTPRNTRNSTRKSGR